MRARPFPPPTMYLLGQLSADREVERPAESGVVRGRSNRPRVAGTLVCRDGVVVPPVRRGFVKWGGVASVEVEKQCDEPDHSSHDPENDDCGQHVGS